MHKHISITISSVQYDKNQSKIAQHLFEMHTNVISIQIYTNVKTYWYEIKWLLYHLQN